MNKERKVTIAWHDEPKEHYATTVMIDSAWTEGEDDDNIFFYFATEKEFESAFRKENDLEFWIVESN